MRPQRQAEQKMTTCLFNLHARIIPYAGNAGFNSLFNISIMYSINKQATKIFTALLDKLQDKDYLKLHSESFMPLTIEKIATGIETPFGKAFLISLVHYYEQNGDLMRDPEMVFIVVDKRQYPKDFEYLFIYPQMYQQDSLGIYEESVCMEAGRLATFIARWQQAHAVFADQWLYNIKIQGFLK